MKRLVRVFGDVGCMVFGSALIGIGSHSARVGLGAALLVMGTILWLRDAEQR